MWRCCFPRSVSSVEPADSTPTYESAIDAAPDLPPHASGGLLAENAGAAPCRSGRRSSGEGQAADSRARVPLSRALSQPAAPTAQALQRRSRKGALDGSTSPSVLSQLSSGADSVFTPGSDSALGRGTAFPFTSDDGHLDLAGLPQASLELSPEEMQALGRGCKRLTLPSPCTADTVRSWLKACPDLEEITARDITEDRWPLSAVQARNLRYFRTLPPGPSTLVLGLKARAVVPRDLAPPPDLDRLREWVEAPETLPMLSREAFVPVSEVIDRYVLGSAQEYRQGLWITQKLRIWAPALMKAVPAELLSDVDAANHAEVLKRLCDGKVQRISYRELLNFVKPSLKACWDIVARPGHSWRYEQRSREELQALATLRHWVLAGGTPVTIGQRERLAATVRGSEHWSDPVWRRDFIGVTLKGWESLLKEDPTP